MKRNDEETQILPNIYKPTSETSMEQWQQKSKHLEVQQKNQKRILAALYAPVSEKRFTNIKDFLGLCG
jgi:hypothetical protein